MKLSLFSFIRSLSFAMVLFLVACTGTGTLSGDTDSIDTTGTTGEDGGGVGTTVNKPGIPSLSLFPDFSAAFPDATLGDSDSASLVRAVVVSEPLMESDNDSPGLTVGQLWMGTVSEGSVREGRVLRAELSVFGALTVRSITQQGLSEADEDLQSVEIETETGMAHLADTDTNWVVRFMQEPTDSEYVRYYFVNGATGFIEGTYVAKTDEGGSPVRGILAYVNPVLLNETPADGKPLVAFAFDVTDPSRNLFALRETYYHRTRELNITYHLHQQCDTASNDCVGEYAELWTDEARSLNEANNLRFSWNDGTNAVCLAEIGYGNGTSETEVEVTHSFTGPATPADEDVTDDVCEIMTPHWGSHRVTESDLPQRYGDSDPAGGTALQYYVDGIATTGWDSLTPALIDGWLDGSGF